MNLIKHADGLMKEAQTLFSQHMSTMRHDYRGVAEDRMRW